MTARSIPPCDHELRPGTAVCLRCQHAERAARRARQRQMMARGTAVTLVVGVLTAIGIAAAAVIRDQVGTRSKGTLVRADKPETTSTTDSAADSATNPTTDSVATAPVPQRTVGSSPAPAAVRGSAPAIPA